ncbi:MAG: 5-oxoprolinase subunit PxpA [Bryobacteraceae bacterium]|jgi:UPF0271 protein
MTIDLNCDLGEMEGAALAAALMESITSASIACGGHAGDDGTMERTARLALARGVRIGAHPGYPDRAHFGRVAMPLHPAEIERAIGEQIGRLERIVRRLGGAIAYVKPHGALYNLAARDNATAAAIGRAAAQWKPGATLFGLAGSAALELWRGMGLRAAAEAFADRRYEPDGSLRPRQFPDALLTDPREAAAQAVRLARAGGADTICVHADTPGAAEIARACRAALAALRFSSC